MTAEVFLDTNIFIYAASSAAEDSAKQSRAEDIILQHRFGVSSQVLQEFISNALRKKKLGISEHGIDAFLTLTSKSQVLPVTHQLVVEATILRRRYKLSHWDATIVAAAQKLGCKTLYSEDFSDGQTIGDLKIVNPFVELG